MRQTEVCRATKTPSFNGDPAPDLSSKDELKLAVLARGINAMAVTGRLDIEALGVTHDSRASAPGSVFVAIRGEKTDAHRFIPQAVERGAIAIISELPSRGENAPAWIQVGNARAALALSAAAGHGHTFQRLKLVGITRT